jgi:hypothetical protein
LIRWGDDGCVLTVNHLSCVFDLTRITIALKPTGLNDPLKKLLRAWILRPGEQARRLSLLQDSPFVEETDPISHIPREAHLMGYHQ